MQKISPCLWFDSNAEDAVQFYASVFKDSKVGKVARYGEVGHDIHGRPAGSVMTIDFEIMGQTFTALNGGPAFKFNEAMSLQVFCDTQEEIDSYWDQLCAGVDPASQQCGWLKDKFGLSWQIVPRRMVEWMSDPVRSERVMAVMLKMKKLDIELLQNA